jgi:hypothetical protein
VSLTKGPLRVCVGLVKGFIRVRWRGFRVMTQVDLGLTGVCPVISVNDGN